MKAPLILNPNAGNAGAGGALRAAIETEPNGWSSRPAATGRRA